MRVGAWMVAAVVALAVTHACTSVEVCTAGAQVACDCPGGARSVQVCKADGSGLGACACGSSSGSGGGGPCTPGATLACYSGPKGTEGVGTCKAGVQVCNPDGLSFGVCAGEVKPRPENCDTPEDESCDGTPGPCGGLTLWSKSFGDVGDDAIRGLVTDAQGNATIAGYFHGTVDFGGGPLSAGPTQALFVAAFDVTGKHLWSKAFPGGPATFADGLARDPGGDLVLAASCDVDIDFGGGPLPGSSVDICLVKLDAAGGHVWSQRFSNGAPSALAVDPAGNILLAGQLNGDLGGGAITGGSFVAKLDPEAKFLWARQGTGFCPSLTTDASGDVLLTAQGGSDLAYGGTTNLGGDGGVVAKLGGASGAHVYSWVFAGSGFAPLGVAVDPQGDLLATGYFSGPGDFGGIMLTAVSQGTGYLAKFDPGGKTLFAKALGDKKGFAQGLTVATGPSSEVALSGLLVGPVDFGNGAISGTGLYVAKLAPSGAETWAHAYANSETNGNLRPIVAVDGQGGVIVAGTFSAQLDFGQGVLSSSSATDNDMFIARLSP